MNDFLAMGGYAAFVWPAYGVAALVMVALLVASRKAARAAARDAARLEAERPRRRPRRQRGPGGEARHDA